MKLPVEPMQVIQMDIKEAYEVMGIVALDEEGNKEFDETQKQIKYGIDTKFYLINYLAGNYVNKNKQQIIIIEGKQIPYTEFYEEIEKRIAIMKKLLFNYIEIPDIIKQR